MGTEGRVACFFPLRVKLPFLFRVRSRFPVVRVRVERLFDMTVPPEARRRRYSPVSSEAGRGLCASATPVPLPCPSSSPVCHSAVFFLYFGLESSRITYQRAPLSGLDRFLDRFAFSVGMQVATYACIYTSKASNLARVSRAVPQTYGVCVCVCLGGCFHADSDCSSHRYRQANFRS